MRSWEEGVWWAGIRCISERSVLLKLLHDELESDELREKRDQYRLAESRERGRENDIRWKRRRERCQCRRERVVSDSKGRKMETVSTHARSTVGVRIHQPGVSGKKERGSETYGRE